VEQHSKLAIIVGGGPAPGINSVISSATIRARLERFDVIGIKDGFQWLMQDDISHTMPLTLDGVSRLHYEGGSLIGTARANPTKSPALLQNVLESLLRLDVTHVITIGGDDTAFSSMKLHEQAAGRLKVVHVPKTIDNDLDLPGHIDTFGYQTARHHGVNIVHSLMTDAETTSRWYFVIAMGRTAGHLALGIGKAAGAHITLIPEEFPGPVKLRAIVDTLAASIIKRVSVGRQDGVAILAEGIALDLDPDDLANLADVERDAHGHIRLAEINFGDIIKAEVQKRLADFKIKPTIVSKNIGYEVRCADPIPFDMECTRDLGYCAARYIIEGGTEALVSIQDGRFRPIKFSDIMDPHTGRMRVRMVDIESDRFKIAQSYMLRLKKEDFDDPHELSRLATAAGVTSETFRKMFSGLVAHDLPPMSLHRISTVPKAR